MQKMCYMIIFLGLICQPLFAVDFFVFEMIETNGVLISSYKFTASSAPDASCDVIRVLGRDKKELQLRAVFTVTEAQYNLYKNDFAACPQALKDAAKVAAADDRTDFERKFDKLLKAFALTVLDEINILRAQEGFSERTIAQLKTAVRTKYQALP